MLKKQTMYNALDNLEIAEKIVIEIERFKLGGRIKNYGELLTIRGHIKRVANFGKKFTWKLGESTLTITRVG